MNRFAFTIVVSMCTFFTKLLKFLTDEIYRVPLRSYGGFESEYINASFVNVSDAYNYHYTKSNCCTFCSRATSRGMPT